MSQEYANRFAPQRPDARGSLVLLQEKAQAKPNTCTMDRRRSNSTFGGSLSSSRSLPNIGKTALEPPETYAPETDESSANHESSASGEAALDPTGLGFNLSQKEGRVPKSSRTFGDGYGFRYFGDDERHSDEFDQRPKTEYDVNWDGENDPMHPRSMSKARKWLIVWIVSFSSACVYAGSHLFPFFNIIN